MPCTEETRVRLADALYVLAFHVEARLEELEDVGPVLEAR
jgi:hypothetical protein